MSVVVDEDQNKGRMIDLPGMISKFQSRYAHNRLPYERAKYLQTIKNPVKENQFFTVQSVTRTLYLELEKATKVKEKPREAAMSLAASLFSTGPSNNQHIDGFEFEDADTKKHLSFTYRTLMSRGPATAKDFEDPDTRIGSVGDGKWSVKNVEADYDEKQKAILGDMESGD